MQGFKVIDFIETILLSYDAQYWKQFWEQTTFLKIVLMQGFKVIDFIETILLSYDAQCWQLQKLNSICNTIYIIN